MKILTTLFKTILLLSTLGYLVFALVKVSRPAGEMLCTGVECQFTDSDQVCLIDKTMLNNLLTQHKITPKGKKMGEIALCDIERKLMTCPYIDSVTCYQTASGKLCIRVTPLHPLFHVYANDGDEFYVSPNGKIIPAGGLNTDLPIVTGHVSRKLASTKLLTLCQFLTEDEYWSEQTQQVNIDSQGNIEIIPRFSGQKILLGDNRNITEKLQRVRLFYEKGMPKTGWNKYNLINATYQGQIICKKE